MQTGKQIYGLIFLQSGQTIAVMTAIFIRQGTTYKILGNKLAMMNDVRGMF